MLDNVMGFYIRIFFLDKRRDLDLAEERTHDENIFKIFGVGHGFEHVEQMFKRGLACHTDERFGFAKSMRAHACAPARHGNYDFEGLIHGGILPR
jgi:hypothetical protein